MSDEQGWRTNGVKAPCHKPKIPPGLSDRGRRVLLALLLALGGSLLGSRPVMARTDEVTEAAAEELFRGAFEAGVTPREREDNLKRIRDEYAETEWADDACWVLAELAEQAKRPREAQEHRMKLLGKYPKVALEAFTKRLDIYQNSRIPKVLHTVEIQGRHIVRFQERLVRFNPVPMVVHEDAAIALIQAKQYDRARKHIAEAIKVSPGDGVYVDVLNHRLAEMNEQIKSPKAPEKSKEDAGTGPKGAKGDDAGQKAEVAGKKVDGPHGQ